MKLKQLHRKFLKSAGKSQFCRSGDGTVTYESLAFPNYFWDQVPGLEYKFAELQNCEHRNAPCTTIFFDVLVPEICNLDKKSPRTAKPVKNSAFRQSLRDSNALPLSLRISTPGETSDLSKSSQEQSRAENSGQRPVIGPPASVPVRPHGPLPNSTKSESESTPRSEEPKSRSPSPSPRHHLRIEVEEAVKLNQSSSSTEKLDTPLKMSRAKGKANLRLSQEVRLNFGAHTDL